MTILCAQHALWNFHMRLQPRRLCCNPHIYTWCLVEGCLKAGGDVTSFARSIGLVYVDSPLAAEQARQRYAAESE